MIAWVLVGIFGATTVSLAGCCLLLLRERLRVSSVVDQTMAMLKTDRDRMLATALEARGVQQVSPDRPPVVVDVPRRRDIGAKIAALEARDRAAAQQREAQRRAAMDRDERVRLEEADAARLVREVEH